MTSPQRLAVGFALLLAAGCGSGGRDAPQPGTSLAAGSPGSSFDVQVQRGTLGTIRSADGRIACGAQGTACTARYGWTEQVVLTAVPQPGYMFGSWVGSCSGAGACVLDTSTNGADKFVGAVFGPEGETQHPNFSSPAVHGRAFFDRLAGLPGSFDCSSSRCHGPTYAGAGIALSCNGCHASAGWSNWQQNCSFCHGARTAATKAGYDLSATPELAAPPDDVGMRLTGVSDGAAGAHQKHVNPNVPNAVRGPIACSECHVVPATAIHTLNYVLDLPFGPLSRSQGAQPTWEASTLTCGANYCHGGFAYGSVRGAAASLSWGGTLNGCQTCHGMPPTGHAFGGSASPASCAPCHPDTVRPDGTIDLAKGKHINGQKDAAGGACDACHWFPNSATRAATGAHLAHFGLTAAQAGTGYGDLDTLEARYPGATPTTAPAAYGFGCGNCHPIALGEHSMGSGSTVAKVSLFDPAAPSTSLKAKNSPSAAYDAATKTCSGVYCHSTGQASPSYRTTPAWTSTTPLTCGDCHDNPPRYASGAAGSATANTHVSLADDGYEFGHFGGLIGPWLSSQHGVGFVGTPPTWVDSAPITCQTCHAETVDPSNTGPSGFYYLDTTGNYQLAGGDPSRVGSVWYERLQCTSCHTSTSATAPVAPGKTLPLRHVNGTRDVSFDAREALPAIGWLPAAPNTPVRPYWLTGAGSMWSRYGTSAVYSGSTASFSLSRASYDPSTKTCSGVDCHLAESPRWGTPYQYYASGSPTCYACHPNY